MRPRAIAIAFACSLLGSLSIARDAAAFQIETPFTGGCHESITAAALRDAGWPGGATPPAATGDLALALDDLTFTIPAEGRDPWALALLLGVRSNDIRDYAPTDVASLIHIHNDPADQAAHCCRRAEDDGLADADAAGACRAFMEDELAAGGLLDETVDLEATERITVFLAFRGEVELEVPRFAYRLGRALHALEDGYTHAFRDPQTRRIRHVLNWIDFATADDYDPDVDGHPHVGVLDDCRRDTPGSVARVRWATDAAAAVMAAIADDAPGRADRVAAALDDAFAVEPGCGPDTDYCDAPELAEAAGCGCGSAGGDAGAGAGAVVPIGAILLLLVAPSRSRRQRQRQRQRQRRPRAGIAVGVVLLTVVAAAPARADTWLIARAGGALDRGAVAVSVGARRDLGRLSLGGMAEWNPWISFDAGRASRGALNLHATAQWRWHRSERFALHSRLELGTSTILTELVGVERYNTGLYAGASLLGVSLPLRDRTWLVLDPSHFAFPAPQLVGFPFHYRQFRVSVGIEHAW